jgi:uncharacterized secreted repeat protein (TIGR03808 family)
MIAARRSAAHEVWLNRHMKILRQPFSTGISRRAFFRAASTAVVAQNMLHWNTARAESFLRGALDATHEGLSPGSPDDQSSLLTLALQKAEAEERPLFLPPGRYRVSNVALPAHTHLIGVPGKTVLAFGGGHGMLSAEHAALLRLEGLTLDGERIEMEASALLDAVEILDCVIEDCAFLNSHRTGVKLDRAAGRIERCRALNNRKIGIDSAMGNGVAIRDNVVEDSGNTGILVCREAEGADGTIVTGNRISRVTARDGGTGQNGNGVNLDKANGVIISGNIVEDCAFSAIRCFSSDAVSITGNIGKNSGEMAMYVEFASEGAIVSDNFLDGGAGGISFANFMEHGGRLATCSGNIVRNIVGGPTYPDGNLQIGAGISVEADAALTGNVVEDCVWGLKLGWGPYLRDVTASGNVIRRVKIGIGVSVVEGGGPAVIAGNLISEASEGAILGMRWADVATGELVEDAREAPEWVRVEGNEVS